MDDDEVPPRLPLLARVALLEAQMELITAAMDHAGLFSDSQDDGKVDDGRTE